MKIGIDASRAFIKKRTGIEEYSYQVIKHLVETSPPAGGCVSTAEVVLYLRKNQEVDFELPSNWTVRKINFPRFWTQIGLSLEMLFRPVDVLFVPAHTVPCIHPKKTVVTIHGLEYEIMPEAYSWFERWYMRFSIKNSCRWAEQIISVSKNTKEDLMRLYGVLEKKINIVYEGYLDDDTRMNSSSPSGRGCPVLRTGEGAYAESLANKHKPYLLFIGRIEKRKNIIGIIKAFEILKERYGMPHRLILAGRSGYGYEEIKEAIEKSKFKKDIIEMGFISEEEKWELLRNADVFLFPTFYEGFGIPVLEAQSVDTPVVTSNVSSLPEVAGGGAAYCDPNEPMSIVYAINEILGDKKFRDDIIEQGHENVKKFSWEKCADQVAKLLVNNRE